MPSRRTLADRLAGLRAGARRAFAVKPETETWSVEDAALLDRVADTIVKRGMAAPALIFLESLGPMNFLGSQTLHFLTPILDLACETREIERAAGLLERRDAIPRLAALIEAKSAAAAPHPRGTRAR